MASELRPLLRPLDLGRGPAVGERCSGAIGRAEILATITGMGTAAATRVTERLLAAGSFDHAVVVGIAGAVDPALRIAEVVVPEVVVDATTGAEHRPVPLGGATARGRLRTSDEFVLTDDRLADLRADGVVAVDMETGAIGAACERHGCPWSVFRAISDRAGATGLNDVVLSLVRPDGSPSPGGVARFLVTRPWDVPALVRLGRDAKAASEAAAGATVRALAQL